ncbi:helix-turn-helix domain-containing protein [Paenibacillus sinopodophylli]|uniref:helix-turn-helix domain-containing protein n=1 Tax=Paenibacillus sinopodophylli TaxID=1837342 RepID=UPI00110C9D24|nr:helix-turn-helix domain-containing protein [Paenibacillus sinopodophylli]
MRELLIVDDEKHAVRGIRAGVSWEDLGFTQIHEAYSVNMAKQVFDGRRIDVLICDIEMPQETGFELLEWVKLHSPSTETMFLTCHADFRYAQKALQLGSCDYMLKPVRFEMLEKAVRKAVDKLEKVESEREKLSFVDTYAHYYNLWEAYQPLRLERFWQDLINRAVPASREKIREALSKERIELGEAERFQPVLISIQRWHKELTLREEKIMEYALRNAFEELALTKQRSGQLISLRSGALLVIIQEQAEVGGSYMEQLRKYIAACNDYFFCDICCYVGEPIEAEGIPDMYDSLVEQEMHNVTRRNEVIRLQEYASRPDAAPLPIMNGWTEMLKYGRQAEAQREITIFLEQMRLSGRVDGRWLNAFYEDMLQMMYHVLHFKGLRAHQVFSEMIKPSHTRDSKRSLADLGEWVNKLIHEVMRQIQTMDEGQTVVGKVRAYITSHLNEDLSRDDIAGHVCLHPDYLARLFKGELGLTISEYVLQERIQKAKELLAGSDLAITTIAYELGYGNYSYFSKMFKKATQMNPQEYRKLHCM